MTIDSEKLAEFAEQIAKLQGDMIDKLENEREKRYMERFAAQEKAVSVAQEAQRSHDERANGLADKLAEQYKEFIKNSITKDEYERRHQDLIAKIDALRDFKSDIAGRETAVGTVWKVVVFVAGIAIALLGMWIRKP